MLLTEPVEEEQDLHLAVNFEMSFPVVLTFVNPDGSLRFRHDGNCHGQDVCLHEAQREPLWQLPGGRSHDDVCLLLLHERPKCTVQVQAWLQRKLVR